MEQYTGYKTLELSDNDFNDVYTKGDLYTAPHRYRIERRGTLMKLWVDDVLILTFDTINTNNEVIGKINQIDIYQHRADSTIRNFYIKAY
jgi:hypothetical protein